MSRWDPIMLTGQVFGRLTVIGTEAEDIGHRKQKGWECVCSCGQTLFVAQPNLRNGHTKSCGCLRVEKMRHIGFTSKHLRGRWNARELKGQRFSRLIVLERSHTSRHGQLVWTCKCDCGALCKVQGRILLSGNQKSCGCLRRELAQKLGRAHIRNNASMPTSRVATPERRAEEDMKMVMLATKMNRVVLPVMDPEFADALRACRAKHKLTQVRFAIRATVAKFAVHQLEQGLRYPGVDVADGYVPRIIAAFPELEKFRLPPSARTQVTPPAKPKQCDICAKTFAIEIKAIKSALERLEGQLR